MKPHHPTPEAIELTEGEKEKAMNDFLMNTNLPKSWVEEKILGTPPTVFILDFSTKTLDELTNYKLALAVAFEKCYPHKETCDSLRELFNMVEQAGKDALFEGQQLPWK